MTERTYPLRMPKGWTPPVPAWTSAFDAENVCMSVVGFQHPEDMDVSVHLGTLAGLFTHADICDFASCDAGGGLRETVCILYWMNPDKATKDLKSDGFERFWGQHSDPTLGYGVFREMTNIPFERAETLFSGPEHQHGMSQARTGLKGPIDEHQYWGGMRDRIALSAHDALETTAPLKIVEQTENRLVITAHENLCIIRSGQDWSKCEGEQLREYLEDIEPTLEQGMAFLRDKGEEVNCYACRYMRDQNADGTLAPRSFGLAYFRSMKDLEDWAEHHPTHLKIFNGFLAIAPKYGPNLQLRLWHEVSVLPATEQRAEYVNCRAGTGLSGGLTRN